MENKAKCCKCSEPATVFLSTIVGSEVKELSFCKKHAEEAGVLNQGAYGFIDYESFHKKAKSYGPSCTKCGITLNEVKKLSRFGCPQCYEDFEQYLDSILQRMHKSQTHLGKIPKHSLSKTLIISRIEALEGELDEMIDREQFEDAAQVRDTICKFKKTLEELTS